MIRRLLAARDYLMVVVVLAALVWPWIKAPGWPAGVLTLFVVAALFAGALAHDRELMRLHERDTRFLVEYEAELDDADALRALVDALCATKRRSPAENQAIRDLRAHVAALSVVEDESEVAA